MEWHDPSEKKPRHGQRVLVWDAVTRTYELAVYETLSNGHGWFISGLQNFTVAAWAELPLPPKSAAR